MHAQADSSLCAPYDAEAGVINHVCWQQNNAEQSTQQIAHNVTQPPVALTHLAAFVPAAPLPVPSLGTARQPAQTHSFARTNAKPSLTADRLLQLGLLQWPLL
jgi:hypothetical protein